LAYNYLKQNSFDEAEEIYEKLYEENKTQNNFARLL
jgi:pentatricopeptide repeat protein